MLPFCEPPSQAVPATSKWAHWRSFANFRRKEAAVHALLLDPLTAAVLSPREIRKMTYEMFDSEREFLPGYK